MLEELRVSLFAQSLGVKGKVSEKRSEFAMIKKRYKHKHPSYIKVDSELEELAALRALIEQMQAVQEKDNADQILMGEFTGERDKELEDFKFSRRIAGKLTAAKPNPEPEN